MKFDIVHGTNAGRNKSVSCTDLVNFYPEIEQGEKAKFTKALIGCPGYRLAVEALTDMAPYYTYGVGRGIYTTSTGRMFVIVNRYLFEIKDDETATYFGTLETLIGKCRFADNGTQMLIVDGHYGYIHDFSSGAITVIPDADFPDDPKSCIFTDGYFIVNSTGTGRFYFSSSYDGTAWSALDFATAEYSADVLVGIAKTSNGTIWMIGETSLELWSNVGTANLPWRRISGSVKEIGCIAPDTIASNGSNVFWLGNGLNGYGAVFMGSGYEVARISTPAIEAKIKDVSGIETADAFVYTDEGHSFYVLNLNNEYTFVYDVFTGEWHRRATLNKGTGENKRQSANGAAYFNGKTYCISSANGNVYEMSLTVYDEDGEAIKREIVTNHISNENRLIRHTLLEIDCEKGVGLVSGEEPSIMMRFSDDGGHTWSNQASDTPGAIGEYMTRTLFRRLGCSRDRVYEIVVSDAVKWAITQAYIEAGA